MSYNSVCSKTFDSAKANLANKDWPIVWQLWDAPKDWPKGRAVMNRDLGVHNMMVTAVHGGRHLLLSRKDHSKPVPKRWSLLADTIVAIEGGGGA